jgi:hypothetical protein
MELFGFRADGDLQPGWAAGRRGHVLGDHHRRGRGDGGAVCRQYGNSHCPRLPAGVGLRRRPRPGPHPTTNAVDDRAPRLDHHGAAYLHDGAPHLNDDGATHIHDVGAPNPTDQGAPYPDNACPGPTDNAGPRDATDGPRGASDDSVPEHPNDAGPYPADHGAWYTHDGKPEHTDVDDPEHTDVPGPGPVNGRPDLDDEGIVDHTNGPAQNRGARPRAEPGPRCIDKIGPEHASDLYQPTDDRGRAIPGIR